MNDKAKIAALRAALREMRAAFHINMLRAFPEKHHEEIAVAIDKACPLALTADDAERAPEAFTDAMYLVWDGFDNSMSCEERAAIYFAVRAVDPAAPIAAEPAPKLTECRHCGLMVALNQAPATPTATADSAADEGLALGDYYRRAERLAKAAEGDGLIITITATPRRPLAMGNFDMVVDIRRSRASYQEAPCP